MRLTIPALKWCLKNQSLRNKETKMIDKELMKIINNEAEKLKETALSFWFFGIFCGFVITSVCFFLLSAD